MIDTIVFQLHSINSKTINLAPDVKNGKVYKSNFNRLVYERLLNYESKYIERSIKFKEQGEIQNDLDTHFLRQSNQKIFMMNRNGAIYDNKEKTEVFFFPVSGKMQSQSSDYHTNFRVLDNKDTIEFTLAIPKYFYGHNIAQFVPNIDSKRFKDNPFSVREFFGQTNILHDRIREFIFTFFADLSVMLSIPELYNFDISDVEIKRLDFCYNQCFKDSAMVTDFIECQKKFYRGRANSQGISSKQIADDRNTSLYYRHSTDGFFFKIYKKGDEFMANDFPRLQKINNTFYSENTKKLYPELSSIFRKHFPEAYQKHNGNVQDLIFQYYKTYSKSREYDSFCFEIEAHFPFKLNFLKNEAEKILRYEMSFTSSYISTIYKKSIYRKDDTNWKKLLKKHNLIKRYDLLLSQGSQNKAKHFKFKYSLNPEDRFIYEAIDRSLHKKHAFFIQTPKRTQLFEQRFLDYSNISTFKKYKLEESHEATLSHDLLKLMLTKFKEEIDFFQIKEVDDSMSIIKQIDLYNEKVTQKIEFYKKQFGNDALKKLTHTKKRKLGYSTLNKPRLVNVLEKLDQGLSLEQIATKLAISKSAAYQLQNDLKIFNIHKQSVRSKFNPKHIRTDFRDYYEKFFLDRNYHRKLFPNPYLISFDTIHTNFTQ
ncbi:hypothetical protein [Flavobacterium soli]|uniref:hypothetical protein n=1 Tax=Flavobacterium soli TaxID=344881 RepID=UPI00041CA3F8|nr:hypothetical protein [Flavobacterium soli]